MSSRGILLRLAATLMVVMAANACARPVATATAEDLTVKLLYPTSGETRKMGQGLKSIVQVLDKQGAPVTGAQVTVSVRGPSGEVIIDLPAALGSGDAYRTDAWFIP